MTVTNTEIGAFINAQTEDTSVDKDNDFILTYDASASAVKKAKPANLGVSAEAGVGADGWAAADAMTYGSADDPTYTMTCAGDQTTKYYPGMRIKLTQSTGGTKYFIVTATSYSSSTTITLYGGTDYNLENEAISNPYYSSAKAPAGFPLSPAKWTVTTADTSNRTQTTPTNGTWYNIQGLSISIPIGIWRVYYQTEIHVTISPAGYMEFYTSLSTDNDSETDTGFTCMFCNSTGVQASATAHREKLLDLAAKTAYYLVEKVAFPNCTAINMYNALSPLSINAVCAYL